MSEVKARASALLQESFGPSEERIRGTLRDLGFSGYAAETFCALVRVSHATAGDLVLKTGVADSKIYYALDELAEKGLVEVQDGKPKTYRVVPAKEVEIRLSRLVEAEYEKRRAATARLGSLLEPLRAATKSPDTDVRHIGVGRLCRRTERLEEGAKARCGGPSLLVFGLDETTQSDLDLFRRHDPIRLWLAVLDLDEPFLGQLVEGIVDLRIGDTGLQNQIARGRMAHPNQCAKRLGSVSAESEVPQGAADPFRGRPERFLEERVRPRLDFRHPVGQGREGI